jgi:hypothetical protein
MPTKTRHQTLPHERRRLEDLALDTYVSLKDRVIPKLQLIKEPDVDLKWAYSYAGRPHDFIAEIVPDWYGSNWTSWRSFVGTVFAIPFEENEEYQIFRDCTDLVDQPTKKSSRVWMPVGRRGGKSRILAAISVYLGCCYDWSHYLDPGELGVLLVLAADRRQARVIMGYVKAFLDHPKLKTRVKTENAESVLFHGNILVEVGTASYRAVRSRTIIAALCDEIAFWHSDESSANPDTEIIAALEPAMATIPNALLLGASSPYARRGVLWNNFERYFGKDDGPLIWRAPTRVMNPTVPQSFIDEKYEEDPYSAAAEYGAEFRSDVDAFITKEAIDSVTTRGLHELPYEMGMRYYGFVDPSGGSSDSMTLAIGHIDPQTKRGVLDVLRERRPQFSPEAVVEEFVSVLHTYRVFRVVGDHYAGEWPRERFRIKGVEYNVSKASKSDIYVAFLPIVNAGRCELLDNSRLYNQLLGLDRRISRGGHETIDHSPGTHDDLANVVAGVMHIMLSKRQTLNVDPKVLAMSETLVARRPVDLVNLTSNMHGPRW